MTLLELEQKTQQETLDMRAINEAHDAKYGFNIQRRGYGYRRFDKTVCLECPPIDKNLRDDQINPIVWASWIKFNEKRDAEQRALDAVKRSKRLTDGQAHPTAEKGDSQHAK